jgi:hypothetical protein
MPIDVFHDAYMHSAMRLRTRYSIDLTFEEWKKISDNFLTKAQALTKNHVGDYEGWIKIRGEWVAAYYNTKRKCIKTFYARPPDFNIGGVPLSEIRDALEAKKNFDKEARSKDLKWVKSKIEEALMLIGGGHVSDAQWLLEAIVRIDSDRPTKNPEHVDKQIKEYILAKRHDSCNV